MRLRLVKALAGAVGLSLLVLLPIDSSRAEERAFDNADLKKLDTYLDSAERDDAHGTPTASSVQFRGFLARKIIAIHQALLSPSRKNVASDLTQEEREYFLKHQFEFKTRVLARELGQERASRIRRVFRPRLSGKNSSVRREAIWWLLEMIGDAEAVTEVESLLKSPDKDLRFQAAIELADVGNAAGTEILESALASDGRGRALSAARALSQFGNPRAKMRLFEILQSTTAQPFLAREQAIYALGNYKGKDVEDALMRELGSKDVRIVGAAMAGLQLKNITLDSTLVRRLFEIIEHPEFGDFRRSARLLLLEQPTPGIREKLLASATSKDPVVKETVLFGLMKYGEKKDVGLIVGFLDDEQASVKAQAEYALRHLTGVQFGDPQQEDSRQVIENRKAWWKQHKDDAEYRQ